MLRGGAAGASGRRDPPTEQRIDDQVMHFQGRHGTRSLSRIKPPAVAGLFYPDDPATLGATVDRLLGAAQPTGPAPKAVIAPHAGYRYSGAVAASAYARLAARAGQIRRVVLVGPSHHVAFQGLAVPGAQVFTTPLGPVEIDADGVQIALADRAVETLDAAFAREHSLEVHLPFLQRALGAFRLVPVVAGTADPETVARVLGSLWGGDETAIVLSTDLSHFLDYESARRADARTDASIRELRADAISPEGACGSVGLAGLLVLARQRSLAVETVDLRNSGDTAGDRSRVVGYGAWTVLEATPPRLDLRARRIALEVATNALEAAVRGEPAPALDSDALPEVLRRPGACFVTLHEGEALRGCIGSLSPVRPLADDLVNNARAAALNDPRFEPLTPAALERISLSVSVVGPPGRLHFETEEELVALLRPGVDGVILREGERRGTFLPAVWDAIPEPAQFVRALKRKAGLTPEYWSSAIEAQRYTTETFS